MEREESQRQLRKVKINLFANNLAELDINNIIFYYFIVGFGVFSAITTSIMYTIGGYNFTQIEHYFVDLFERVISLSINEFLNIIQAMELITHLGLNIEAPHSNFKDYLVNTGTIWVILLSFVVVSLMYVLEWWQYLKQRDLADCSIIDMYAPKWTIFANKKKELLFLRNIRGMKGANISKPQEAKMLEIFFQIEQEQRNDWTIIETNKRFLLFYDYKTFKKAKLEKGKIIKEQEAPKAQEQPAEALDWIISLYVSTCFTIMFPLLQTSFKRIKL